MASPFYFYYNKLLLKLMNEINKLNLAVLLKANVGLNLQQNGIAKLSLSLYCVNLLTEVVCMS